MEACCALRLEPVTFDGFNETIERQNKQRLKQEELETNSGGLCCAVGTGHVGWLPVAKSFNEIIESQNKQRLEQPELETSRETEDAQTESHQDLISLLENDCGRQTGNHTTLR